MSILPFAQAGSSRLSRAEKLGICLLGFVLLGLGVTTVMRSAFMMNPKTDFQVFARAAWAVRAGEDPFAITDNNGWHYVYPPAFAILMAPLADPYPFMPHDGYLPFWASSGIWYLLGLACAVYSVHAFASVVVPDAAGGTRRWWHARLGPFLLCLGGIVLTISRGQVNTVVMALIAAGFAEAMRNRRVASGALLATAAVVKIIPVLLVLFPILRRDWRAVAGGFAMAALLLLGLPAAIWGVDGAIEANRKTVRLVLAPALTEEADQTRQRELHGANATDSQSVQAAVQSWIHPDRSTRPDRFDPVAKWAQLISSIVLLGITLLIARRRMRAAPEPADNLILLGCLCAVMILVTPISHLHYHLFAMPLVCGLWLRSLATRPRAATADRRTTLILSAWAIATMIPALPGFPFEWLRTAGLGAAATVGLWAHGLCAMGSGRAANRGLDAEPVNLTA